MNNDDPSTPISTADDSIYSTRWTLIDAARGGMSDADGRRALNMVTERYRPLILGFIRKNGINPADCEDLCHDYLYQSFTRVLNGADRAKGRFRTFLFHTLRAFIASHWRAVNAAKRGAGRVVSLEEAFPNGDWGDKIEDAGSLAELDFEVDLALCKHREALQFLRQQYESRNELEVFDALSPHLLETTPGLYETLSIELGREPASVRKALSRLRERYVEKLIEWAQTERWTNEEDPKAEVKEILKLIIVGVNRAAEPLPDANKGD